MKVLDPGHRYWLDMLDIESEERHGAEMLTFVKRQGPQYPGNLSFYPGTNCQEVLRALIDRVKHLNSQATDEHNASILHNLREALWLFEARAAKRYGRTLPPLEEFESIESEPTCPKCAHIRCSGNCEKKRSAARHG